MTTLLVSSLLAILLTACGDGESEPVTIMPIGDSITHAQAGTPSYRCFLDGMLRDAGVAFDFVGGETLPYSGTEYSCPAEFDQDHEGHTGTSISGAGTYALPSVEELKPDVALVHLGTNDIYAGWDPAESASRLEQLIVDLQAAKPDLTILVAQIIPCDTEQPRSRDAAMCSDPTIGPVFHDAIGKMSALSTPESTVMVVDMRTGFQPDYLRDAWHPSEAGDEWMATRWLEALEEAGLI